MNLEVSQLMSMLESEWLDPDSATEEEIEALMARRQEILSRLQSVDGTTLSETEKTDLRARLQGVQRRDQELIAALHARMELIANQLGNAVQGRAAVRGYRAPEDDEAKLFIRPA